MFLVFFSQFQPEGDNDKTVCCFCCKAGTTSLAARLNRAAFCAGESISVCCQAENNTTRVLKGIKARIIQVVTFTAKGETKQTNKVMYTVTGGELEKGGKKVWKNQPLKIPAIPPTIRNCSIINVAYKVEVRHSLRIRAAQEFICTVLSPFTHDTLF